MLNHPSQDHNVVYMSKYQQQFDAEAKKQNENITKNKNKQKTLLLTQSTKSTESPSWLVEEDVGVCLKTQT